MAKRKVKKHNRTYIKTTGTIVGDDIYFESRNIKVVDGIEIEMDEFYPLKKWQNTN